MLNPVGVGVGAAGFDTGKGERLSNTVKHLALLRLSPFPVSNPAAPPCMQGDACRADHANRETMNTRLLLLPLKDEIEIDIGDPVFVQKEAEDLWCEGANLRTGLIGIFPIAHVVDVDYSDFDPNDNGGRSNRHCGGGGGTKKGAAGAAATDVRKERYLLEYIGYIIHRDMHKDTLSLFH